MIKALNFRASMLLGLFLVFSCNEGNFAGTPDKKNSEGAKQNPDGNDGIGKNNGNTSGDSTDGSSTGEDTGKVGDDSSGPQSAIGDNNKALTNAPKTIEDLQEKCESEAQQAQPQQLVFPEPQTTCWGVSEQQYSEFVLQPIQGRIQAMVKQTQQLNLPANAQICDLSIDFSNGNNTTQQIYYDDEIFIMFNDLILAASSSQHMYDSLEKHGEFFKWDFKKIMSKNYDANFSSPYCAGYGSTCKIPPTQTNGVMEIKLNADTVKALNIASNQANGQVAKVPEFSFITTGDNDLKIDCKHSEFKVQVQASYIIVD